MPWLPIGFKKPLLSHYTYLWIPTELEVDRGALLENLVSRTMPLSSKRQENVLFLPCGFNLMQRTKGLRQLAPGNPAARDSRQSNFNSPTDQEAILGSRIGCWMKIPRIYHNQVYCAFQARLELFVGNFVYALKPTSHITASPWYILRQWPLCLSADVLYSSLKCGVWYYVLSNERVNV